MTTCDKSNKTHLKIPPPSGGGIIGVLRFLDNKLEKTLILICYTFIVTSIVIEVLRRFGLSFSSVWGEEMARYLFIYLVWFGAALGIKKRIHIRIDIIHNFVSDTIKGILNVVAGVVTLFFAVVMFVLCWETFMVGVEFGAVTDGLRISKAYFMFATVIGFFLVAVRCLQGIYQDIQHLKHGVGGDHKSDSSMFEN